MSSLFTRAVNATVTRLTPLWRRIDTGAVHNGCSQQLRSTKEIDMYTTKLASALGAAGLTVLVLAGPAAATPDTGAARNDIGQGPTVDVRRMLNDIDTPLPAADPAAGSESGPSVVQVDDGGLEFLQIGLGALAGAAFTAAGITALRRRQVPRPA
jgi:hypothetical protein